MVTQLEQYRVEKPWGRYNLPAPFDDPRQIGEVWFENRVQNGANDFGRCDDLLVKYLFTGEKLSVQVHPDDESAAAMGLPCGKSECWYIVDADDDARLGLGLKKPCTAAQLRDAALSGAIEDMLDWKPTKPGDIWFIPPGTIHAIGAGLQLIEVQQNADITYRLYDYGRPRALHLDQALKVAHCGPYDMRHHIAADDNAALQSKHFAISTVSSADQLPQLDDNAHILIPVDPGITVNGRALDCGEVYYANTKDTITWQASARLIIAWPQLAD